MMTIPGSRSTSARLVSAALILGAVITGCSYNPQFFVLPENRYVKDRDDLLRGVFPGWDLNISLKSPQVYKKAEYVTGTDFNYYLSTKAVCRSDSISVKNLHSPYGFLKMPDHVESVLIDSVILRFFPSRVSTIIYVDSSRYREQPFSYLPGINTKFRGFVMPSKTDSLRMSFTATLVDAKFRVLASADIDTMLFGLVLPKDEN